ncbi:MAG TPA: hypothetical protein PLY36_16355 [Spirochaetota bacterium]|nr:hypothetical protein [Spirochaetota bacterium]
MTFADPVGFLTPVPCRRDTHVELVRFKKQVQAPELVEGPVPVDLLHPRG